jgi:hypothetical protein
MKPFSFVDITPFKILCLTCGFKVLPFFCTLAGDFLTGVLLAGVGGFYTFKVFLLFFEATFFTIFLLFLSFLT